MKWYKALFQWFMKTFFLMGYIGLLAITVGYFIDGGKLIDEEAIPISALANLTCIPLSLFGIILMLSIIIWTEKSVDTDEAFDH